MNSNNFQSAFDLNNVKKNEKKKSKLINYRDIRHLLYVKLTEDEKAYCKTRARELRDDGVISSSTYTDFFKYLVQQDLNKVENS